MADFDLAMGTSGSGGDNDILSGSITWSRDGQYSLIRAYSDRKEIETTFSTTGGLTDSFPLEKNYDSSLEGAWTAVLADSDTSYNDVYVRYATDPTAARLKSIDEESVPIIQVNRSPRGYRSFKDNLVRLIDFITPANNDVDSMTAYGFVNTPPWARLRESSFSKIQSDNEQNVPSLYFGSRAGVVDTHKANEKVITATMNGYTRILRENIDTQPTLTDFIPAIMYQRPEYKFQIIDKSYRESPDSASKTGVGTNDELSMVFFIAEMAARLRQQNIQVTLTLDGDWEIPAETRPIEVGDTLGIILFRNTNIGGVDEIMNIDSPVLSVQYDPNTDNTNIVVGRT